MTCGAKNHPDAVQCSTCGSSLVAQSAPPSRHSKYAPSYGGNQRRPSRKSGGKKTGIIICIVLLIAVGIGAFFFFSNRGASLEGRWVLVQAVEEVHGESIIHSGRNLRDNISDIFYGGHGVYIDFLPDNNFTLSIPNMNAGNMGYDDDDYDDFIMHGTYSIAENNNSVLLVEEYVPGVWGYWGMRLFNGETILGIIDGDTITFQIPRHWFDNNFSAVFERN